MSNPPIGPLFVPNWVSLLEFSGPFEIGEQCNFTVIGEEADAGEEETGEAVERKGAETSSREGINWEALTLEQQQRQPRRIRGSLGILRMPKAELARVFQSISLDSFTLLSTGTTSRP